MSLTPDIKYYTNKTRSPSLTHEQLLTVKENTLYLLENVGVKVPNKRALKVYQNHGAKIVDQQVCLPREIVEKFMSLAPSEFILVGREERFDLHFNRKNSYLIATSAGIKWRRPEDGKILPTCKQNLIDICRFYDASPMVAMIRPTATSIDYGELTAIHDCHAMLTCSLKNARAGTTLRPDLAHFIIEMAHQISEPVNFNEEDLTLELIRKIGSEVNFLMEMHTLKEMRRMRLSEVLRQKREDDQEREHREIAIEIYNKTTKEHCPEPLPDNVIKEMDIILEKAKETIL